MPSIRLAANYIAASQFVPFSGDWAHLQIIYDSDDDPTTPLLEAEVQPNLWPPLSFAGDWKYMPFGQPHGANTSYIDKFDNVLDADRYKAVDLALRSFQNAENTWGMFESVHNALSDSGANIDYDFRQNSNSYVRTVLFVVGIDLDTYLDEVLPADATGGFPGEETNVLFGAKINPINTNAAIALDLTGLNSGTDGDDFIRTGIGDDIIQGAGGDDQIFGGDGVDTAVYMGIKPSDYDIRLNPDGTWTVRHARGAKDEGTDTLTDIEKVRLGESETFDLAKKGLTFQTDFAFVIDTTGSMGDDIGAVKARASTIIDRLFADDQDARVGIVGFRDNTIGEPTQIILPFTDQDDLAARKAAALAAINGISVGGGGDEPETGFDGLLKALNGTMGQWRPGAGQHKVVLFTDASAKDGALAGQVAALAADIGATITSESLSVGIDGAIASFELTPADDLELAARDISTEAATEILTPSLPADVSSALEALNPHSPSNPLISLS